MNTFVNIPEWVSLTSLVMLAVAQLLALYRLFKGPTMPDRIVALDLIAALCMGFAIVYAITTSQVRYLDITAIVALVVFIGTVAFATYLKKKYYD
ncbi:MAG: hypothetical protein CVU14_02610 [Bacteroidetes bacterium HGW-Bacteroidetes-9]|jgi:multicomponent Na+:H+ antiporter subunit F|nr:MAG: hypothetical protein CVU14_02610 [Bacteroidetes bacterium HGW-Bacteroidetes-9]